MTSSGYVLLTNAKHEKGLGLIIELARMLPKIPFVAIASQSEREEAERAGGGLSNLRVIGRVDDMQPIYEAAHVVAVPSYQFRETFSRVCIEAHRYGKPVLGSDQANVPYLLRESGTVLPEDKAAWAAELARLYGDTGYYEFRRQLALQNSARFPYSGQRHAIHRIVKRVDASTLIAVGSGLGNMLHVTPMIRNLVRRSGAPVDLVIAEDHSRSLFLLHNPDYANAVFSLTQAVLRRRYRTVFVTHSFGVSRVAFNADRILWSRDWDAFRADGMHETRFNLEAAKHLLGIPYDEDDVSGYFVGDLEYQPPAEPLIGLHAGSKAGAWLSKRWPYFSELAARLMKRGFAVASFGTEDEYVEGTQNQTGGSIEEMCKRMLACSHFVSNDSGLMNIANGLGIPVLAIFGPTNVETRLPLRPTTTAVCVQKACAPCEVRNPRYFAEGQCACIADLSAERVEAALLGHMASVRATKDSAGLQQFA
jgi:hypothetical protein